MCTTVVHKTILNISDNLYSYPSDNQDRRNLQHEVCYFIVAYQKLLIARDVTLSVGRNVTIVVLVVLNHYLIKNTQRVHASLPSWILSIQMLKLPMNEWTNQQTRPITILLGEVNTHYMYKKANSGIQQTLDRIQTRKLQLFGQICRKENEDADVRGRLGRPAIGGSRAL